MICIYRPVNLLLFNIIVKSNSLSLAKTGVILYTENMEQTRRELNKINCRKRILRASRKLFSTVGYEDTMIEDIAKIAEVSKATVYNYFPNKESLLIGTVDEVFARVYELIQNGLAECANSEQKLRRVLEEVVRASADYLSLSRKITYLNSCEESALFATRTEIFKIFRRLVCAAQAENIFRADANPDDIVDVVMGLYLIAQFQWPHLDRYSPDILHEKLNRFFTTMLNHYYSKAQAGYPCK